MPDLTELLAAEAVRQQPARQPAFAELMKSRRARDRRNRFVTAALALVLAAAAAAVPTGRVPALPGSPGAGAPVSGTLWQTGGELGAQSRGLLGAVHFQSDGGTFTIAAAEDGRFSGRVPPGRYVVTGTPHGIDHPACQAGAPVTVPPAGRVGIEVTCRIR